MLFFDGRSEDDRGLSTQRMQCKAFAGRFYIRNCVKLAAEPADLDAQASTVRFIGLLAPKGAGNQVTSRRIAWPVLAEGAGECEQHRSAGQRNAGA